MNARLLCKCHVDGGLRCCAVGRESMLRVTDVVLAAKRPKKSARWDVPVLPNRPPSLRSML